MTFARRLSPLWLVSMAIYSFGCYAAAHAKVPMALRAYEEARSNLAGRIEWMAEPQGDPSKAVRFVNRYARNGDFICEVLGDRHGWTRFDPETGEGWDRHPQRFLVNKAGGWYAEGGKLLCTHWGYKDDGQLPQSILTDAIRDIRGIGTFVTPSSLEFGKALRSLYGSEADPIIDWKERSDGPLYIVTGKTQHGAIITWYINSERDWNAERISYQTDQGEWEMVASLKQWNGGWFPAEVRYYDNGKLTDRIVVTRAKLDPVEAPPALSPTDIGVEPGTPIATQDLPPGTSRRACYWNGTKIVSRDEFYKEIERDPKLLGENIRKRWQGTYKDPYLTPTQKAQLRAASRASYVRYYLHMHEGVWERYVRDFIKRYQLNDEQSQRAWSLLLDCQRRADALIGRDRDKLVKLISEVLAAREAGDTEKTKRLEARFARLRKPVDDLFSKRLKPGLERLPTRAQRKAAEARAQSEPGGPRRATASSPARTPD